jgi:hypothetical protein
MNILPENYERNAIRPDPDDYPGFVRSPFPGG